MTEIIDAPELAKRWNLPESWIRSKVRTRTATAEQIPHLSLGRYCRFEWGSPALDAWLARHREGFRQEESRSAVTNRLKR
jgi:hypothetical protein